MAYAVTWDAVGEHLYETGTKQGMVYPAKADGTSTSFDYTDSTTDPATSITGLSTPYGAGAAWNGLREVNLQPSGADETKLYADDIKYLSLRAAEEFGCTIGAYTSPTQFDVCDGSAQPATTVNGVTFGQQKRRSFGFSYVSTLGNDVLMNDYGYVIHLIYGLTASPSEKDHNTINDSPEAAELSWECSSVPVAVDGYKPVSTIEIEVSTRTGLMTISGDTVTISNKVKALENILYGKAPTTVGGNDGVDPRLPDPASILKIFASGNG